MSRNDRHGRNELLIEYIQYQAHLPHPDLRQESKLKQGSLDEEVGSIMRNGPGSNEGESSINFGRVCYMSRPNIYFVFPFRCFVYVHVVWWLVLKFISYPIVLKMVAKYISS